MKFQFNVTKYLSGIIFLFIAIKLIISAAPTPTIGNATPNVDTFVIVEIANARVANKINSGNTANTLSKIYLNRFI